MSNQALREKIRNQAAKALKKIVASRGELRGYFYYAGNNKDAGLVVTLQAKDPKGAMASGLGKKLKNDITGAKFARGVVTLQKSKLLFVVRKGDKKSLKEALKRLKKEEGLGLLQRAFIGSADESDATVEISADSETSPAELEFSEAEFSEALEALSPEEQQELLMLQGAQAELQDDLNALMQNISSALDMISSFQEDSDSEADSTDEEDEDDEDVANSLKEIEEKLLSEVDGFLAEVPANMRKVLEAREQLAELNYAGEDIIPEIGKPLSQSNQHMMANAFLMHAEKIEQQYLKDSRPQHTEKKDGSAKSGKALKTTLQRSRDGELGADDTISPEYVSSLMVDAIQTQKKLTGFVASLAPNIEGATAEFKDEVKGTDRIFEKWNLKYKKDDRGFESFTDISRASIVYETPQALIDSKSSLLAKFKDEKFKVVNEKNRFKNHGTDDDHYRDFLLNLEIPLGPDHSHICELQLHLKQMVAAKKDKKAIQKDRYTSLYQSSVKLLKLQKDPESVVKFTEKAQKKLENITANPNGTELSGHDLYDVKRYLFENKDNLPADLQQEYLIWSAVASQDLYDDAWVSLSGEEKVPPWKKPLEELSFR